MDTNTTYSEEDGEKVVTPKRRWKIDLNYTNKRQYCFDLVGDKESSWVFLYKKNNVMTGPATTTLKPPVTIKELGPFIAAYEIKKI